MEKQKASTIDEYIRQAPDAGKQHLEQIRKILKEVAPDAKEVIKWSQPVFEEKRILFSFSAFKSHLNFMPTRSSLRPFESDLAAYKTGTDTVQFPYNEPLPVDLIKKIASYRANDVRENDARWMGEK